MQPLGKADLGVSTFFASPHANDKCGANGLPLTPNSIKILGKFQKLKTITYPRLCQYVDMVRGKHERLTVVYEYYQRSLESEAVADKFKSASDILRMAYETLQALVHINKHAMTHRNLAPCNILLDPEGHVKLSDFGRYYMSDCGADITFPIGYPRYTAPEVIVTEPLRFSEHLGQSATAEPIPQSGPKVDVWSLGMILLELYIGSHLWPSFTLPQIFAKILFLAKYGEKEHPLDAIMKGHNAQNKLMEMPGSVHTLIRLCLIAMPHKRPSPSDLLKNEIFKEYRDGEPYYEEPIPLFSTKLRCEMLEIPEYDENSEIEEEDHLANRSMTEIYYLWCLAGGNLESELKKKKVPTATLR